MTRETDLDVIRTDGAGTQPVPLGRLLRNAGRRTMNGPTGVIGAVAAVCICTVASAAGSLVGGAVVMAIVFMLMLGWTLITSHQEITSNVVLKVELDDREETEARDRACGVFNHLMHDEVTAWHALHKKLEKLIKDREAVEVATDVALRLRSLDAAYDKAIIDAGRSDTTAIKAEASKTAEALVTAAIARHEEIDRRIRTADEARAPEVTRRFTETARAVAGLPSMPSALPPPSASAALQRLIGLAEDALATDPDLTDGNGARIDALVRQHLPRLLERHADAARSPSSDLAAVDQQLAEGVGEAQASIEEALALDARARFESLLTEVTFLRTRRGE